jgi:hypothetical protein
MADKPELVDVISEATRQVRRRIVRRVVEPEPKGKKQSRLGHRPDGVVQWRLETFTPWKLKPW